MGQPKDLAVRIAFVQIYTAHFGVIQTFGPPHPRRRKWAGHFRRFPSGHLRQLVAMPVYGAPGAGQCAVRRAAAATSPRAPGFRYIRPRWVEAARAAAAGRGRKMVPSAAARLCSTAAHGWRARAGSGAGGGSMRAGGMNLALGAAPLLRWAARGAVRDGHPRRAGVVQKGLEPLARGARCRMRARRP